MISNIASYITDVLLSNQIIENRQLPVYQYGFEIFLSSLVTMLITALAGFIFKSFIAAFIFLGIFATLRSICGGYHADTYWKCNLLYSFVISLVLFLFRFATLEQFKELHYISIALSLLVFTIYAPVSNENKPLSNKQVKLFRILSMIMIGMLALTSCLLKIIFRDSYSILIDTTILSVSFSMFVTNPRRGGEQR